MKSKPLVIMFLFVATFTVGCNQEPTISQQIDTAQTETVNAARDMKDYTFAQKAEFVTKMQGRLGALNEDLDQLSARIESASDAIKADAKLKLQALRDHSAEFMSKENDAGSNINREGDGSIVERRSGRRISGNHCVQDLQFRAKIE
jgi:predicted  nucleic acid-binding Zn-ribbon protein